MDQVTQQLTRILGSSEFHAPERVRRFLEFIIQETLAGRSGTLKAFSIAQEVFGRNKSFDAQNDPVVRIEAGRLRRALERYYLVAGSSDPVVIRIPKGGYVPSFELNSTSPERRSDSGGPLILRETSHELSFGQGPISDDDRARYGLAITITTSIALSVLIYLGIAKGIETLFFSPFLSAAASISEAQPEQTRILIEPIKDIARTDSRSDIAEGLTGEIIAQLATAKDVSVTLPQPNSSSEDGEGAPFALQGSLREQEGVTRVHVRVVDRDDGAVVWSNAYSFSSHDNSRLEADAEVARQITVSIAETFSVRQPNLTRLAEK